MNLHTFYDYGGRIIKTLFKIDILLCIVTKKCTQVRIGSYRTIQNLGKLFLECVCWGDFSCTVDRDLVVQLYSW